MHRLSLYCLLATSPLVFASAPGALHDDTLLGLSLEDLLGVEVVTIATGKEQSQRDAPAITTVITAANIEAMGATNLDEVLATVPGLHVSYQPIFNNPHYVIRGLHSPSNPEVLLLINGIPEKYLYSGNRSDLWGEMPVRAIARIEVIRGPGSAVYGADAFSGVINILTKGPEDLQGTEIGARLGSFHTKDAWVLHGGEYSGIQVAAMVETHFSDGHPGTIEEDIQTQTDALYGLQSSYAPGEMNNERKNVDARLEVAKDRWRLRMGLQGRYDMGPGTGVGGALDPRGLGETQRYNLDVTYHNPEWSPDWDVSVQARYNLDDTNSKGQVVPPNDFFAPNGYWVKTGLIQRSVGLEANAFYTGFEQHLLRVGVGVHHVKISDVNHLVNFGVDPHTGEDLAPDAGFVNLSGTELAFAQSGSRRNMFTFFQDEWRLHEEWTLTAGLRFDKYSDFGDTWNPRLALVWKATDQLTAKLLYGEAFRAPSFNDIDNRITVNNLVATPEEVVNAQPLGPEKMKSLELGLSYQFTSDVRANLNLFQFQVEDKIEDVNIAPTVRAAQNVGEREGQGLEWEAYWNVTKQFTLAGHYAHQRVADREDRFIGIMPRNQAYLRADWKFLPHWHLNTQVKWTGMRERYVNDDREDLDGYASVDLTLRRVGWKQHWDFAFSVRNLLDEDRREATTDRDITTGNFRIPQDAPLPERSLYLEARYHF